VRVAISGASGLIGTALARDLRAAGHEVVALVRRPPGGPHEAAWNPAAGHIDPNALDRVDAVVNLSGASIAGRPWTASYRKTLRESRLGTTSTLAHEIARRARSGAGPRVFASGSAVGAYGDTGDRPIDESGPRGQGFLADLVQAWEAETAPAADAGVRVGTIRTGLVLASGGGTLGLLAPIFKLGLGGRIGSGRQWMSWITLADEVAGIRWILDHEDLSGPVDLTAPNPVTNAEFTKALGNVLHRPTLLPVPATPMRLLLRQMAEETLLISQRVLPRKLMASGFEFRHPELAPALRAVLG
jgi:uncharacterized protein (TIGR01777 family)